MLFTKNSSLACNQIIRFLTFSLKVIQNSLFNIRLLPHLEWVQSWKRVAFLQVCMYFHPSFLGASFFFYLSVWRRICPCSLLCISVLIMHEHTHKLNHVDRFHWKQSDMAVPFPLLSFYRAVGKKSPKWLLY